jgi:hypothetical protein
LSQHKTVIVKRQLEPGSVPFAYEQPVNSLSGHPYLEHPAPIAIFNGQGSGAILNIKLLNCRPMTGPQSSVSTLEVRRITAVTGGDPVLPVKHDSGNADLPAQVVSVFAPLSVTGTTSVRRAFICSGANFTRPMGNLTSMLNGDSRAGLDSGEFMKMTGEPQLQKHTLNEGQGISIVLTADGPTFCFGLSVMVRNKATNQCYRFNDMIEPRFMNGTPVWALLNGAGSGVVLEVLRIQIRELGTDEVPYLTYEPIDGIDWGAEDAVYMMADSSIPLPANIFLKKNCITTRAGAKYGGVITSPAYRRITMAEPPWGPGITGGPQIARRGIFSPDMDTRGAAPITLREGQGIALLIRNASAQLFHEFTATIDIETIQPTPAEIAAAVWTSTGRTLTS